MIKAQIIVIEKQNTAAVKSAIGNAVSQWEQWVNESGEDCDDAGRFDEVNLSGSEADARFVAYHEYEIGNGDCTLSASGRLTDLLDEAKVPYQTIEVEYDPRAKYGLPVNQESFAARALDQAARAAVESLAVA